MKLTLVLLLSLIMLSQADPSDHWAVLVAGSNSFWNYRHQADVCHAYHIMKRSGIPENQIIVMAYDDIANNSENPIPGKIFNRKDGEDVYEGCKIDYKGEDVTPDMFLAVLSGEAEGKSLQTDENSKVFVYFSDHGAPGLIAFPKDELYAENLHKTIHSMHHNKKYGEMVIYIEACESGSMFEGILEDDINVYATTAANPTESSFGYYCYPDDKVNGVSIGTCLGDEYSINWMEDSDRIFDNDEACSYPIEAQFKLIKSKTKGSHVQEYGDLSLKRHSIGKFQGV